MNPSSKASPIKFTTLDSLRGLAALCVAVFHFRDSWAGYLAVDFFLVLSGFILTHCYLYQRPNTSLLEFISHRFARLYPLHIYTLVVYLIVVMLLFGEVIPSPDPFLYSLFQHLTLTHNVGLNPNGLSFNYPSWSVSVEFWVNILFFLLVTRYSKNLYLLLASAVGLVVLYYGTGHLQTNSANYFGFLNSGLIRGGTSFVLGIIAYRLYLQLRVRTIAQYAWFLAELAIILAIAFIVFARDELASGLDLFAPAVFTLAVTVYACEQGVIAKILKPFHMLGVISYSVYLNQIAVLLLVRHLASMMEIGTLMSLPIYIVALLLYSYATFMLVEDPLRKKLRNSFARFFQKNPANPPS